MDSPDTDFQQGQWDDFDSFLDLGSYSQQEVEWTAPRTHEFEWTPLEATTQDSGAVDESSKQATGNDGTTLRDKATEDGGHEAPTTKMKRAKRPKGQARNKAEDLERRRAQVRVAQQAYRQRKEATVVSLQEEVTKLRATQVKLQELFEKVHIHASRLCVIQRNNNVAGQLRKLDEQFLALTRGCNGAKSDGDVKQPSDTVVKSSPGADTTRSSPLDKSAALDEFNLAQISPLPHKSTSLPAPSRLQTTPDHAFTPLTTQPPIPPFDPMHASSLPLSLRLRHEGLKRGLSYITATETPYALLTRIFRYRMFTMSRSQISQQLRYYLSESSRVAFHQLTTNTFVSSHSEQSWSAAQGMEDVDLGQVVNGSYEAWGSEREAMPMEKHPEYVSPEGLQTYLAVKGLLVDSKSATVAVKRSSGFGEGPGGGLGSLFEELIGSREVVLSTKTLLQALLDCVVCLDGGPGFRVVDIDEAIRSMMIAVISDNRQC